MVAIEPFVEIVLEIERTSCRKGKREQDFSHLISFSFDPFLFIKSGGTPQETLFQGDRT